MRSSRAKLNKPGSKTVFSCTGKYYRLCTDVSPGEKEDIELLEQALEKALWVRTGTGPSKKDPNKQCVPRKETKEGTQAFAVSKGNQTTTRSTSKSASLARKEHKRPAGIVHHQPARKSQQAVSASGSVEPGQLHTSAFHSKNKTSRGNALSGNDLGRAAAISMPSSNNTAPVSHTAEPGAPSLPQQNGLWDKVTALQRKPVPGRSHFMERIRATFPKDWPCGSPDQTRALVDRLTHQGHDLVQHGLVAKQTPETAAEPGSRLQMTAAELQNFAGQVKQEWEAWDRWRPEGGCLCPTGANSVWANGMTAPLPPTVTYTTEAELRELEKLRMRVALLQQEMHLEQVKVVRTVHQISVMELEPINRSCAGLFFFFLAGSVGHLVPSAFIYSAWTWMSQRQRAERRVLPAGLQLTTNGIQEANTAAWFQDPPALTIGMGCTTGHLACQTQPQTSLGQEGQSLEAGGAKVPEVLSSLERLSQATGGMEKSWYRCIFPFGIISLVIGVAGTGVTYTYNDLPQTKVVSVVLLVMGLLLLLMATACWTVHKKKRRKKKEGGSFTSEQCPL
ncbi:hypothetical protein GBF38_023050 [Nibea albiflora]|uniref:Uncharacterized protein n=1 Tax=Nibea albiflora TaxID=240163 RepID=A0ACB7EYL1_NIBAL|nr:hypothetical protein GBF38_023050 [Nibea albiflora]